MLAWRSAFAALLRRMIPTINMITPSTSRIGPTIGEGPRDDRLGVSGAPNLDDVRAGFVNGEDADAIKTRRSTSERERGIATFDRNDLARGNPGDDHVVRGETRPGESI